MILYKYRELNDSTYKIIENGEIFFPSIDLLNDPFEGSIPYIITRESYPPERVYKIMYEYAQRNPDHAGWTHEQLDEYVKAEQAKGLIFDEKHLEEESLATNEFIKNNYGIYCMTSKPDNLLMWSHYARDHKGICIGFDSDELFNSVEGTLCKVKYSENMPEYDLEASTEENHYHLIATKAKCWEYEDEYRLTKIGLAKKALTIPKTAIKEIIIGCAVPDAVKNPLIRKITSELPNCKIYRAKKDKHNFGLTIY